MTKLVAIGDSLTQGVQSGAVFKTGLSFPALIAESMGLKVGSDFRVPSFPRGGLPLNIERLLRSMRLNLGTSINPLEWIFELPFLLGDFIDDLEDFYERGPGAERIASGYGYHNLAVSGFRVFHSFTVNAKVSADRISKREGRKGDDFFGLPAAPMYRIAQRVLSPNPEMYSDREQWTQIDNLEYIIKNEGEVENLILFLGANDCLGTVRDLELNDMPQEIGSDANEAERSQYNLTSETVFREDYKELVDRISSLISKTTNVFVGTVPYVTIPPITQGISGDTDEVHEGKHYFSYYGTFFANPRGFNPDRDRHLTGEQVRYIDARIRMFNDRIREVIGTASKGQWHVVDICDLLDRLALKRNTTMDIPREPLHKFFDERCNLNHPLLDDTVKPTPSVLRFQTDGNLRTGGGFFSLDCFHPTTIGYGLIAEEFLRKMQSVDVPGASPENLNWASIIKQDTLIQNPPLLWDDVIEAAESHPRFADLLYRVLA